MTHSISISSEKTLKYTNELLFTAKSVPLRQGSVIEFRVPEYSKVMTAYREYDSARSALKTQNVVVGTGGGAAVGLGVAATLFQVSAVSKASQARAISDPLDGTTYARLKHSAESRSSTATALFVTSGLLASAVAYYAFLGPRAKAAQRERNAAIRIRNISPIRLADFMGQGG